MAAIRAPRSTSATGNLPMITTIDLGPSVLAYRVDGKVERSDIDTAFGAMDQRLKTAARIRVYTEVVSFGGISFPALWEDLKSGAERWSEMSKIDRVAVVTDVEWMRSLSELQGKLLPGMHVRTFPLARTTEAQAWIQE
jgi:hypothetical protein